MINSNEEMHGQRCASCNSSISGNYCAQCGQANPRENDLTLKQFFLSIWEEISSIDSRLISTLKSIFVPGRLTLAYLQHRRSVYLPPFRLYLILSGLFFFFAWGVLFNSSSINDTIENSKLAGAMSDFFVHEPSARLVSNLTALFKILSIFPLALMLALVFIQRKITVVPHIIFAIHYYCADFLFYLLISPLVAFASKALHPLVNNFVGILGTGFLLTWLCVAVRRVYDKSWKSAVGIGLILLVTDIVVSSLGIWLAVAIAYLYYVSG